MAREENERSGISGGRLVNPNFLPPTREVRIQKGRMAAVPGMDMPYHVGAAISGMPTGHFTDAWVEYLPAIGGSYTRATSIPIGAQCRFYCSLLANSGGGTAWAICITVVDLYDMVLKDFSRASTLGSVNLDQTGKLVNNLHNTPWVMPNHNLNLSYRLFASFDSSPADPSADMYY